MEKSGKPSQRWCCLCSALLQIRGLGFVQASGLPNSINPKLPVIFVQRELMEFPRGLRALESWWCRHCAIRGTGGTGTGSVLKLSEWNVPPSQSLAAWTAPCQAPCLGVLVQSAPGRCVLLFFFFSRIAKRLSSIKFPPCGSAHCPWVFMLHPGLDTISGLCISCPSPQSPWAQE